MLLKVPPFGTFTNKATKPHNDIESKLVRNHHTLRFIYDDIELVWPSFDRAQDRPPPYEFGLVLQDWILERQSANCSQAFSM